MWLVKKRGAPPHTRYAYCKVNGHGERLKKFRNVSFSPFKLYLKQSTIEEVILASLGIDVLLGFEFQKSKVVRLYEPHSAQRPLALIFLDSRHFFCAQCATGDGQRATRV